MMLCPDGTDIQNRCLATRPPKQNWKVAGQKLEQPDATGTLRACFEAQPRAVPFSISRSGNSRRARGQTLPRVSE